MATDDRNFRSAYYEKVGFRSIEEKKSLEMLLKDKPLDKGKLKQFCLRFTVPGIYRKYVWKLLLDVLPPYVDSHSFVMHQREQQYYDLLRSIHFMRIVNEETPKPQLFLTMWLLEMGKLKFDHSAQLDSPLLQSLFSISQSLCNMFDSDVDIYWISKGFFESVIKFYSDIPKLITYARNLLEKDDHELFAHLVDIGALDAIPLHSWLCCCFAGIISESSLEKIWDKLTGGSCKILVFVAIVLLFTLRRPLMKCLTIESVLKCLNNVSEEASEVIVNQAIEMWQQYGFSLPTNMPTETIKGHIPLSRQKVVA
ncbi:TBC1 domain family member 7 [Anabrus simplex]|uniref:TBC1 domain family member 7 n=1 Tax=Anabrus simplex TaxID=316456 RepID=UPI0035A360C0